MHLARCYTISILIALYAVNPGDGSFNTDQCGITKECVSGKCSSTDLNSCEYLFSYSRDENSNSVQMELFTKRSSPAITYIAVGFSSDQQMGDDKVTQCATNGDGNPEVHLSVNPGKSNEPVNSDAEHGIVELLESQMNENYIYCKFIQNNNVNTAPDLSSPNLNSPHYIFLVRGPAASPKSLRMHSLESSSPDFPFVSSEQFNVFSELKLAKRQKVLTPSSSSGNEISLVDIHGILMIIAWLMLLGVGIYSARYMRSVWANKSLMGLKIWFHIHRTLNFIAVCLIIVSAVLIFLSKGRWEGPWFGRTSQVNWTAGAWHSLCGLIAIILAIGQPLGALLRCGIDDPNRPIFNWGHRSAGLVAFTLASVALFIAIIQFKGHFSSPGFALSILIGFFVCIFVLIILSEILRHIEQKQHHIITAIEMQTKNRGTQPTPSDTYYYQTQKYTQAKLVTSKKVLFGFVSGICAVAGIILVLLIALH